MNNKPGKRKKRFWESRQQGGGGVRGGAMEGVHKTRSFIDCRSAGELGVGGVRKSKKQKERRRKNGKKLDESTKKEVEVTNFVMKTAYEEKRKKKAFLERGKKITMYLLRGCW